MQEAIQTTQRLCSEVARLASSTHKLLTERPWNRFEPEDTLWWLVPSPDWPAHRYSKFFFEWDEENRGSFFCGVNVEKGVDRKLKGLTKAANIMDEDWAWHSFIADLEAGRVGKLIEPRLGDESTTWKLAISSNFVGAMKHFDPLSEERRSTRTRYLWIWKRDERVWSLVKRHDPARLTLELAKVTQLEQIPDAVSRIEGLDFLWVDFYLGVLAGPGGEDAGVHASDVSPLWFKSLSCFEPLV